MNNTTRRYPRTLGEAFQDADYAQAIEHHTPPKTSVLDALCFAVAVAGFVGLFFVALATK